ncbi:carboxypeptidase-like regulatory domain-containing protein [Tellurirhabdus bombi]|uniref:carboxypeptidase-like regulatory domain-containing protein n=1 Tax=Tellurirhabdus bombi TaxID=2907205 RepID=UPI001F3A245E|nr:carboxypeptidase-like regulatory domain-containing protein [Tellurirhabdus bombi]
MKKWLLFLIIGLGIESAALAQVPLTGYVRDEPSGKPIPQATVQNRQNRRAMLSDENGYFRLSALAGDTLQVSCVGYKTVKIVVLPEQAELIIKLVPDVVNLREFTLKGWTEEEFKRQFLKLNPVIKPKIIIEAPRDIAGISLGKNGRAGYDYQNLAPKMTFKGPVSALYGKFSRQAKRERRTQEIFQQEIRQQQYETRMDTVWLARITDLKGPRLSAFVKFCKLPEEVVLKATEYDLIVAIRSCLRDFLAQEQKS